MLEWCSAFCFATSIMSCAMTAGSSPIAVTMQVFEVLPSWNEMAVPPLPFVFVAIVIPSCRAGRTIALPTQHLKDGRHHVADAAVAGGRVVGFGHSGSCSGHSPAG